MNCLELVTDREKIVKIVPSLKQEIRGEQYPFIFLLDNQVVANGAIKLDLEEGDAEVKMLKALEKNKGYGRMFVDHLKAMPDINLIWGESLPKAISFWIKMGAKFYDDEYKKYINTTRLEYDLEETFEFYIEC